MFGSALKHDSVETARTPASVNFVLDSRNRNQNSRAGFFQVDTTQPWNDFTLQRPQALMQSYCKRLTVGEIRFPWYIPNITARNNVMYVFEGGVLVATVVLPVGFYTPDQICSAINDQLAVVPTFIPTPPTFAYSDATMRYTLSVPATIAQNVAISDKPDPAQVTYADWERSPNLLKTMGFIYAQDFAPIPPDSSMTGNVTLSSYTDYVDICSPRLLTYSDTRTGNSSQNGQDTILARLYATDEISIPNPQPGVPQTCAPFMIHRQFMNPQSVQWSADASVDWLDIQVRDMYGELVPLPRVVYRLSDLTVKQVEQGYPDFQITMTASED